MRFDQSKCHNSFTRIDGPAASPLGTGMQQALVYLERFVNGRQMPGGG
jgi:hypothetical protein